MSLKYMQYMPFFSFATFRGVLLDSAAAGSQLSPTYGVANFPYIVYPGFTNVDGVHVPQDIAMNYCRYLFAARMPNIGNSDIYNSVIETGPNVYRLENLMYVLDNLCIQHKWRLGEPDKGFIWKIPNNEGYEEFIPEPTQLVYGARQAYLNANFTITYNKGHSFLLPISNQIDIHGGPIVVGTETGWLAEHNYPFISRKFVPNFLTATSPRDYSWIYFPNTGNLHGITFDNLYIYQQLQQTWEIIGQNLFVDIPGKNYTNISIPVNICIKRPLHPVKNETEYSSNDYSLYKNFTIDIKKMISLWEIPDKLGGEDVYPYLDEKPGWLPLGTDVNSICDYGRLKIFVTENEELLNNMKKLTGSTEGSYLNIYNNAINGQGRGSNFYNAYKALQYNYFNQFFIPTVQSRGLSDNDGELARLYFSELDVNREVPGRWDDPYIPFLFKEIVFGGYAMSTEMCPYSQANSSYNNSKFDNLKAQIDGLGFTPGFKYHYNNSNIINEYFYSPEVDMANYDGSYVGQTFPIDGKVVYYSDYLPDIRPISAMSYALENVYRDVSDDIEIETVQNNGGFKYYQKYISPKRLLHSSKFNNATAYENAQKNLIYNTHDIENDRRLLNLSNGETTDLHSFGPGTLYTFKHPIDDKTFVTQYRFLHSSFSVSCTYVGSKSLRSKIGIRNRLSSISKVYAPFASAGRYSPISWLHPKIQGQLATARYDRTLNKPLSWEKSVGIVQSAEASVGPSTTNFDNNTVKYYYGWIQFPDNILSKDNFDMMSMNNYIRLCKYIVDSNPQKILLFEIPGMQDIAIRTNGFRTKNGRRDNLTPNANSFIPREAYCDFDSFLDAEPPFDNAVLFLWCGPDNPYPTTYAEGHVTNGSLEKYLSGINIESNSAVQGVLVNIDNDTPNVNMQYTDFIFFDNNQNLATTDTQFRSEKIASFYCMSHNIVGTALARNNLYVNYQEYLQKIHDVTN